MRISESRVLNPVPFAVQYWLQHYKPEQAYPNTIQTKYCFSKSIRDFKTYSGYFTNRFSFAISLYPIFILNQAIPFLANSPIKIKNNCLNHLFSKSSSQLAVVRLKDEILLQEILSCASFEEMILWQVNSLVPVVVPFEHGPAPFL